MLEIALVSVCLWTLVCVVSELWTMEFFSRILSRGIRIDVLGKKENIHLCAVCLENFCLPHLRWIALVKL